MFPTGETKGKFLLSPFPSTMYILLLTSEFYPTDEYFTFIVSYGLKASLSS